ncbi:glycosyl hydrolase family 28-related protein [Lactiplantibacillus plantarum]|uniref:right-handed parallel beta-helix repeat-containing protein n=1 Tax=Lactiplantibacillus plantarum TaxID=1590 RepID=UPI0039659986
MIENKHIVNPLDFGAKGDGVSDDSTILQNVIDSFETEGQGILWIPKGYSFAIPHNLTLKSKSIDIMGGGELRNGSLIIGDEGNGNVVYMYNRITNINIMNDSITDGSCGIVFKQAANVTIDHCTIGGFDKAIYMAPLVKTVVNMQLCQRVTVVDNHITLCNYGIYIDRNANWNSNPDEWGYTIGDWTVTRNIFEAINISHIYAIGVDGLICTENVFFFGNSGGKLENIRIMMGHYVIISHNQLFEAGREGIYIEDVANFNISDNNIAWPGQRFYANGIFVNSTNKYRVVDETQAASIISNNIIDRPTNSGVIIQNYMGFLNVIGNCIQYYGALDHFYGDKNQQRYTWGIAVDSKSRNINIANNNVTSSATIVQDEGYLLNKAHNTESNNILNFSKF